MKIVIIGQGYVGLPIAVAAAIAGHEVIGFDINKDLVAALNSGESHIEDIPSFELAKLVQERKYIATNDPLLISDCEVAVIAVPTPLNSERQPDLRFVQAAAETLGKSLKKSTLIINESTSYPGTLRNVIAPIVNSNMAAGLEHLFAISPERVDPGNRKWTIKNTPRLFAGLSKEAALATRDFYSSFCDQLIEVSTPEVAESAKLFENTFRQVNIALVNEFALIMRALSIPVHEVLNAADTKPYGFKKFDPGIGVGGHCIPVDPSYLAYSALSAGVEPRFINLANRVNLEMPKAIVSRISAEISENLRGKKVLICGVAYKSDISDTRESPAEILLEELISVGAKVSWYDPNVPSWLSTQREEVIQSTFDVSIVTVLHSSMDIEAIKNSANFVFDCTGKIEGLATL